MTKLFAILFLIFGLSAATSQSCAYTYNLRSVYGYSNSLPTARAYSDLKYCTDLASGSCCTDTEINNLGAVSDAYVANLTTMVSTRDLYLKNIKDNILPNLLTNVNAFNTAANTFVSKLETAATTGTDPFGFSDDFDESDFDESDFDESDFDESDFDESDFDESDYDESDYYNESDYDTGDDGFGSLLDTFSEITNMTTALVDNANAIKANYGTYQTDRRTCILAMADIQNSARCLSCDPNAQTKGYTDLILFFEEELASELGQAFDESDEDDSDEDWDESDWDESDYDESDWEDESDDDEGEGFFGGIFFYFNFADATCERLQTACKPYLDDAQGQNSLIEAAYASTIITGLTSALTSFNNGNYEAGLEEIMTLFGGADDSDDEDDLVPALLEGYLPYGCDVDGECDWICEGLFMNGIVDQLALVVGGDYTASIELNEERRLAKKRMLEETMSTTSTEDDSNGTWAPAPNASGVTINFAVDPANTNPSTSGKKFGSLNLGNVFVGMMVVISSILLF